MELSIDTHEALYRQAWCQYFGPNVCETVFRAKYLQLHLSLSSVLL